jgi:hypothetical protein
MDRAPRQIETACQYRQLHRFFFTGQQFDQLETTVDGNNGHAEQSSKAAKVKSNSKLE